MLIPPSRPAAPAMRVAALFLLTLFACLPFAWLATSRGIDVNWDFCNYHHFGAFLLLEQRLHVDLMPGQLQTYLNPVVYVPHYLLVSTLAPMAAAAIIGAIHGLHFGLCFALATTLLQEQRKAFKYGLAVLCAILGTTAPLYISEVGTSFSDVTTGLLISSALLLALRTVQQGHRLPPWLGSGAVVGAAVGLKLTNAPFLIGLVIMVAFIDIPLKRKLTTWAALSLGAAMGWALTAGYWSYVLWQKFANPIFPFYNGIFKSPFYAATDFHHETFLPESLLDGLTYPFQWALGLHPTCELAFRDARFAVFACLFVGVVAAAMHRRLQKPRLAPPNESQRTVSRLLLAFFVSSFFVWLFVFSIQRYAVVLEVLSGIGILACLLLLSASEKRIAFTFATLVLLLVSWTRTPDWGHVPWASRWVQVDTSAITAPDALYILMGDAPYSYVLPHFPRRSTFVRIDGNLIIPSDSPLGAEVVAKLKGHQGKVFVLSTTELNAKQRELLAGYNIHLTSHRTEIHAPTTTIISTPAVFAPKRPHRQQMAGNER